MAKPIPAPDEMDLREPTERDVKGALEIEPMALQEEFVRVPADLGYWNMQYAKWYARARRAYADRKRVEAQALLDVKAQAQAAGEKITEAVAGARVEVDPRVVDARRREVDTEARQVFAYGIVDSLRTKSAMLQSLGAHIRAERDPVVKEETASNRR